MDESLISDLKIRLKAQCLFRLVYLLYLSETQDLTPKAISEALGISLRQAYAYSEALKAVEHFYTLKYQKINQDVLNY
ncbi:hypothetical protein HYY74_04540 [Candidatus Woesearchaeota archaeon]|nr:hypothetical protein [Candidatus Woesearchaeota archaeon]